MKLALPSAVRNSLPNGDRYWSIVEPTACALVRMLEGTSEGEDDLWRVCMSINLAWARCQAIGDGADGQRLCEAAGKILSHCADRIGKPHRGPRLGDYTREQRQAVIDAENLYEAIVQSSSPLQLEQAQKALHKMMTRTTKRTPERKAARA